MADTFNSAGIHSVWVGFRDSSGYFIGNDSTAGANGSDSGMIQLIRTNGFDLSPNAPDVATPEGDDGPGNSIIFRNAENPIGTITAEAINLAIAAKAHGASVYTDGEFEYALISPANLIEKDMCLIINHKAASESAATLGSSGFNVEVYPNVKLTYVGGGSTTGPNVRQTTFNIIANPATRLPWGKQLATADEGDTKGVGIEGWSPYPLTMHTFLHDNSTATFTLDKTPAADSAEAVAMWQAGTKLTYNSGTPSTDEYKNVGATVTVVAETAGTRDIIIYQYAA